MCTLTQFFAHINRLIGALLKGISPNQRLFTGMILLISATLKSHI